MQSLVDAIQLVLPEVLLIAAACVLFLAAAFRASRGLGGGLALLALAAAAVVWWLSRDALVERTTGEQLLSSGEKVNLFVSLFRQDALTWFVKGVALAAGVVLVLLSWNQIGDRLAAEYHACLLLIVAGLGLIAAANDLVSLFLALELVSIPTYVLLYLPRYDAPSQEAATKYFLLSIFSSAVLLYGFSYLYGCVGSTNLEVLRATVKQAEVAQLPETLVIALVMVVAGLGFRVTAVPFHFYAPDVFQGAPVAGAALLSYLPKVAGFTALFLLIPAFVPLRDVAQRAVPLAEQATLLIALLAAVSMFLGNFLGLLQNNLKRLLAYSSVAHAGYMLIGLGAGRPANASINGPEALFFYLAVYGAMTLGAFAVLAYLNRPERPVETVDDLAGLGRSHPLIALLMATFMFSLTGLPPTAGFWGKLNLFFAAWAEGSLLFRYLAVFLAINAAIGGWYYLRIVGVMYLRQPIKPLGKSRDVPGLAAILLCGLLTIGIFIAPKYLWRAVERATAVATISR